MPLRLPKKKNKKALDKIILNVKYISLSVMKQQQVFEYKNNQA